MPETAPHKSRAMGWIISVMLALLLYLGSAHPVCLSYFRDEGSWLPLSWENPLNAFYTPAGWVWEQPPLEEFKYPWYHFWQRTLGVEPTPAPFELAAKQW